MPDPLGDLVTNFDAQNETTAVAAQSVLTASLTNAQGKIQYNSFPVTADEASVNYNNRDIASFDRYKNGRQFENSYDKNQGASTNSVTTAEGSRRLFTYPLDLATRPENMNYMLFDIFVTSGQGLDTVSRTTFVGATVAGAVAGTQLAGSSVLGKALGGAGLGTLAGVAVTQGSDLVSGIGDLVRGGEQALNYSDSSEIGYTQASTGFKQPSIKVPTSIALYMPTDINSKYEADYEDSNDFGSLADISKVLLTSDEESANQAAESLGRSQVKVVDEILKNFGVEANADQLLKASQRTVPNPQILQLFKEVKRRSFQFSYIFIPTSEKEALSIYHIIRTFKYYSLPKRGENRMLEFPAEFRITFMHGINENLYLPRIARCVLTSVDVKYHGGASPFTVFKPVVNRNGTPPTKIEMTLNFNEVEILTAERVDQGY